MSGNRSQQALAKQQRLAKYFKASPSAVAGGFREAFHRTPASWLDPTKVEHTQTEEFLRDLTPQQRTASREAVAEYSGAAGFLHCLDGWTLLGRSIDALTSGCLAEAAHLAYYSEVRSSVSILARSGILIVGSQTVAVTDSSIETITSGASTHSIVWDALRHWASTPLGMATVSRQVRFRNINLERWLESARPGASASAFSSFFEAFWGVDLRAMQDDRARRNIASYQPSGFRLTEAPEYSAWCAQLLSGLLEPLGPGAIGTFPDLDALIVSEVLRHLVDPESIESQTRRLVASAYGTPHGTDAVVDEIVTSLSSPGESCVAAAMQVSPTPILGITRQEIQAMLSRALILARFATAACRDMQRDAGLDPEQFAWWADRVGQIAGYWNPEPRPDPLTDLWFDLELGLETLGDLALTGSVGSQPLRHKVSSEVRELAGVSRVGIWSLSA